MLRAAKQNHLQAIARMGDAYTHGGGASEDGDTWEERGQHSGPESRSCLSRATHAACDPGPARRRMIARIATIGRIEYGSSGWNDVCVTSG